MTNLGGHDMPTLIEAFGKVDHDRPICFIAYTIKGFGLPFAGHKDNHAGLMTPAQMESLRARDEHPAGARMGQVRRPEHRAGASWRRSSTTCRSREGRAAHRAARVPVAGELPVTIQPRRCRRSRASARCSTNSAATTAELADRIVTTSPDVTVSTNLGPWVNRRGLFARREAGRHCSRASASRPPSTGSSRRKGQHIELGIAEMNLFILLSALGLSHAINRRAADPDRHALRSVHPARPRCAELRLLPGCPLHPGGDAVGHHAGARRRRASVDRDAADRAWRRTGWRRSSRPSSTSSR